MPSPTDVLVAGDSTLEWHLLRADAGTRMLAEPGGTGRLARLIAAIVQGAGITVGVHGPEPSPGDASPLDLRHHHVFLEWARQGTPPAWRATRVLGRQVRQPSPDVERASTSSHPRVVAIHDAALDFRDEPDAWPSMDGAWVVIEMSAPVAHGALWRHLSERRADRLVVVVPAEELRAAPAQIGRDASWERTAQDVLWELQHNQKVNGLSAAAIVVVSFGSDGALMFARDGGQPANATLFFDPPGVEGAYASKFPGQIPGATTCLTAAIAAAFARRSDRSQLDGAIRAGIAGMRSLQAQGYEGKPPVQPATFGFPFERIAADMAVADTSLAAAPVPQGGPKWSILADRVRGDFDALAERVAVEGVDVSLGDVPVGRFGKLVTIERQEIESYRAIRALIADYCESAQPRPLSIAVFGAPGSGKSFGVKQVAAAVLGDQKPLEFNLSQFVGPDGLRGALHQVRDVALSGRVPLVFWDEFDTALDGQALGWLRHFLAPMQDGTFLEGQIVHPIGRAVFVFAGGTAARMRDFGKDLPGERFVQAKGPDFVSRLRGSLDVLGPNPQPGESHADPYAVIRRALLLRSLLEQHARGCFEGRRLRIDPGVLRGFLETRAFRHGARSMEAVITSSRLAGRASYDRSALPPESLLNLHVDATNFMALVHRLELSGDTLEALARAAHAVFVEMTRARGYQPGERTDDRAKTHSAIRPFDDLPQDEQEQNRDVVRDIPRKLALAGYVMVAARDGRGPLELSHDDVERLAQIEHERWSRLKVADGWQYAPATDKARKLHGALRPWADLPEEEREKDRGIVRRIPRILEQAGYTAIREVAE